MLLSETTGIASFPNTDLVRALSILFNQNLVQGASMLMRRDYLSVALPFPDGIKYHDEWLLFLSCFCGGVSYSPHSINLYRKHGQNASEIPTGRKNIYNNFFYRIKKDNISYKEVMLCEIGKRVKSLNIKRKCFICFCKWMMRRNKSLRGRFLNAFIKLPLFRFIYQKSPVGLLPVLYIYVMAYVEKVKHHFNL